MTTNSMFCCQDSKEDEIKKHDRLQLQPHNSVDLLEMLGSVRRNSPSRSNKFGTEADLAVQYGHSPSKRLAEEGVALRSELPFLS